MATVGNETPVGDVFVMTAYAAENVPNQNTIPAFSALSLSDVKLRENNEFQLAQTMNSPSITFDFTNNYKAWKNEPVATSVVLTTKPNKNHAEEFRNLSEVLVKICDIDLNDTEEVLKFVEAADVSELAEWLHKDKQVPLICVGSGGKRTSIMLLSLRSLATCRFNPSPLYL
jgi:hypothetical protein